MDLKDFISKTIEGIAEGIINSNKNLEGKNCYINPPKMLIHGKDESAIISAEIKPADHNPTRMVEKLRFDVFIGIENEKSVKGKGSVGIKVLSLDGEGSYKNISSNSSKISFSIPVVFPTAEITE